MARKPSRTNNEVTFQNFDGILLVRNRGLSIISDNYEIHARKDLKEKEMEIMATQLLCRRL
jgi:hypothetical protein